MLARVKNMSLEAALLQYQSKISILKKGYESERYRIQLMLRDPISKNVVRNITSVDIAEYRDRRLSAGNLRTGKPLSTSTVRLELSLLSNLFEIGRIEWGICGSNPVKDVKKPKAPPGRDRRLTPREDRQLLRYSYSHSNPDLYSIIVIALETCMRQGEILGLEWERINLKNRIIHLVDTKNGSKRDVPLSLKGRDALLRIGVKSKGKVFGYTSPGIKSTWKFMVKKLKIEDLHFHDLRHEAISRLFELGTLDLMEIASISGHKSLSMLKLYTHLKAQNLVQKLEGNKNKGRQMILSHLIPYPALLKKTEESFSFHVLDFDDMVISDSNFENLLRITQGELLKKLITNIKDSKPIPEPDQYLDTVVDEDLYMIDPLGIN